MNQYIQEIVRNLNSLNQYLETQEERIYQLERQQINNNELKKEMIELLERSISNG